MVVVVVAMLSACLLRRYRPSLRLRLRLRRMEMERRRRWGRLRLVI
jgi:hypothetical protein